jgi:hypothetical protein
MLRKKLSIKLSAETEFHNIDPWCWLQFVALPVDTLAQVKPCRQVWKEI